MSITHRSPSFDLFRRRLRILGGGSEIQRVAGEAQPVLNLYNAGVFHKDPYSKEIGIINGNFHSASSSFFEGSVFVSLLGDIEGKKY